MGAPPLLKKSGGTPSNNMKCIFGLKFDRNKLSLGFQNGYDMRKASSTLLMLIGEYSLSFI